MDEGFLQQKIGDISNIINSTEKRPVIVGIAGGSCSGKTLVSEALKKHFDAAVLNMDDYYKTVDIRSERIDYNFDEPGALDLKLLSEHLQQLNRGNTISKPTYDFSTHSRKGYENFSAGTIIIVDGLLALHDTIRNYIDVKIFVQCSEEKRLQRRIERDIAERGRTRDSVLYQFDKTVKPMHDKHVESTRKYADIIIVNN
jgi:uridine kinase